MPYSTDVQKAYDRLFQEILEQKAEEEVDTTKNDMLNCIERRIHDMRRRGPDC